MSIFELDPIIPKPVATKAGQLQHLFFAPKIKFAKEYHKAVDILQDTLAIEPEPAFAFPGVRSLLPFGLRREDPILGGEVTFEETKEYAVEIFPAVIEQLIEEHEIEQPAQEALYRTVAAAAQILPTEIIQTAVEGELVEELKPIYETSVIKEYQTLIHEKETIERYEGQGGGINITMPEFPDLFGGLTDILGGLSKWILPVAIIVGAFMLRKK